LGKNFTVTKGTIELTEEDEQIAGNYSSERSRDSSVCMVRGWMAGIRFPAPVRNCFLLHSVQTDSGAHPFYYTISKEAFSAGVKQLEREADHSPPSSGEVKNVQAI
jgi:hypothetical protein